MISRIWHGWTTPGNADKYEALLKEVLQLSLEYIALAEDGRGHNARSHYLAQQLRKINQHLMQKETNNA